MNGIPVTTVPRMLVDLTDVMESDDLANVIHEAAFWKLFSEAATRQAMERAPGRKLSVLEEALRLHEAGSAGSKSRNEKRFLRLVRGAGLPEPLQNVEVHGFEVDFAWPALCVEVDGEATSARGPRPTTGSGMRRSKPAGSLSYESPRTNSQNPTSC